MAKPFEIEDGFVEDQNRKLKSFLEEDYRALGAKLARRKVSIEALALKAGAFQVAVPSWGVGTGGTRFARFPGPAEPRNVFEKLEDCEVVNRLVRTTPAISLHIPWDKPDRPAELKAFAEARGLHIDSMNSNTFEDPPESRLSYKFGSLSHTDPYARRDAVSRHIALTTRHIERLAEDSSELDADLSTARLEYGFRSGLWQHTTLGLELAETTLAPGALASDQLLDWITTNGETRVGGLSTQFTELDFLLRWRSDSRDRIVRPTRGTEHALSLTAALPGSEVEHYVLDYDLAHYRPIGERWTAALRAQLTFGEAYGSETSSLPPYLNRFAGGPGTVRGVRAAGLGPRDSLGNPYGGNLLTAAQLEVLTPWPGRAGQRLRVGFFYDLGNVFETEGVAFTDSAGRPLDFGFDGSNLQHSAGIAAEVLIPFGILRLSYGVPIDRETTPFGRVEEDRFQIALGVDF